MEITDESWYEAISDAIDERLYRVGNRLGMLSAQSVPWSQAIDSISSSRAIAAARAGEAAGALGTRDDN